MAFAAPLLMYASAAGAVAQGIQQKNASDANAKIQEQEGTVAAAQGYAAEATQRQIGAMALGRESAAVGQAGAGYGGSAGRALSQDAIKQEQDAQNIRYKAGLQRWGYQTQAGFTRQEGNDAMVSSYFRAGAALLKAKDPPPGNPPNLGG